MTNPIRLRDDGGGADELERAILRCDLEAEVPEGASDAVWAKLSSQLGVAGALGGLVTVDAAAKAAKLRLAASGGSSATGVGVGVGKLTVPAAGGWLTFVKGVVVGLFASGAIWQGQRLLSTPPPTQPRSVAASTVSRSSGSAQGAVRAPAPPSIEPAPAPQPGAEKLRAPVAGPARQRLEASSRPASAPSVAAFVDEDQAVEASRQRASQLREEAQVLRQARAQLRAGAFASAWALLDASQRRFTAPELYQERESLMIEALFRSGQTSVASQRAQKFLATFPESPHAARLRELNLP